MQTPSVQIRGVVVSGQGRGRHFTTLPWARQQFREKLGIDPYPGTLNLRLSASSVAQWDDLRQRQTDVIRAAEPNACEARCVHVDVNESQAAAIVRPQVAAYPEDQIELIAAVDLRQRLGLRDGTEVSVRVVCRAEALRRTVQAYLTAHNVLSLATSGPEGIWAASVFYAHAGWTFYFLSDPHSRHGRNLAANPQVAATLNPDYTDWREIRGVQLEGIAALLRRPGELARGFEAYTHKYPFIRRQQTPAELARALGKVRLYRMVPSRLLFVDNSRGLGHREEVDMRQDGR